MTDFHEDYGPAAAFAEHHVGDVICYPATETGEACTGTILWVQAAGMVGDRHMGLRYVVEPANGSFPDIIEPSEVLATASKSA